MTEKVKVAPGKTQDRPWSMKKVAMAVVLAIVLVLVLVYAVGRLSGYSNKTMDFGCPTSFDDEFVLIYEPDYVDGCGYLNRKTGLLVVVRKDYGGDFESWFPSADSDEIYYGEDAGTSFSSVKFKDGVLSAISEDYTPRAMKNIMEGFLEAI